MNEGCAICRRSAAGGVVLGTHVICPGCTVAVAKKQLDAPPAGQGIGGMVREAMKSKPKDARTHFDLATAYLMMGLVAEAAGSAAFALVHGATLTEAEAQKALAMVLKPEAQGRSLEAVIAELRSGLYRD